ncbi:MAG: tetratricopeptide repeat protein, partial [Candidatus Promineifilaceae bacterium]|nr:tetratricopeptide repeat protein [Candidatus Promineifilaceae bacterium]
KTAEPGAVLISHHTYQHVRGVFDVQPMKPIISKGYTEPIPIYRVLRSKPRSFRTRRRGVEGVETRMVGRKKEIAYLQEAFHQMLANGEQRWVTIAGEAGLGKSRLLFEFQQWLDLQPQLITLYRARARQATQHLSYGLLRDLFEFRFNIRDDDTPGEMRRKMIAGFEEWMEPGEETRLKAQIVGRLLGYDFRQNKTIRALEEEPKQLRNRALAAMIDYFRAVSSEPVVALFEDLHWADESSIDILLRLSLAQTERPVLIVAATRPVLLERRPDFMHDQPFHHWWQLEPLSMPDSRRLVAEILKMVTAVPQSLLNQVAANAGGNPYFVEELVKMLVAKGIIIKEDAAWHLQPTKLPELRIPSTVAGVLQSRLDDLPPTEREILQRASAIGHIFWDRSITHMNHPQAAHLSTSEVITGLAGLRRKEMINERETSGFLGLVEYSFKHTILREVTYETILKKKRQAYHVLAADWLIAQDEAHTGKHNGLIADQLELGGDTQRAVTYLHRAGDQAASRYANSEARSYYSRALKLCHESALETQFDLLIGRTIIFHRGGLRDEEQADLSAAETLARRQEDPERLAEVKWHWAIFHANIGNHNAAMANAMECARLAQESGNQKLEVKGHLAAGRVYWRMGHLQEAQSALEKALDLARAEGSRRDEGNALLNLGNVVGDLGDLLESRNYYEQSLAIDRELGNVTGIGIGLNNLGIVAAMAGSLEDAQDYFEQSLAIARQTGNKAGEGLALGNLGNVTADRGDFAASQHYFEQALANAREIKNGQGQGYALNGLGYALSGQEQYQEAAHYFQEAVQLREKLGQDHLAIESRAGWAKALLAAGQPAQALVLVQPILEILDTPARSNQVQAIETSWICIQVLTANDDPRAEHLLNRTYQRIQQVAAKIDNPQERQSYLENVAANREIVTLWQALQNAKVQAAPE